MLYLSYLGLALRRRGLDAVGRRGARSMSQQAAEQTAALVQEISAASRSKITAPSRSTRQRGSRSRTLPRPRRCQNRWAAATPKSVLPVALASPFCKQSGKTGGVPMDLSESRADARDDGFMSSREAAGAKRRQGPGDGRRRRSRPPFGELPAESLTISPGQQFAGGL